MEQRIGPNIQPLQGAAVDPAFVPGITGPRPAEPEAAKPKDAEPTDAEPTDAEAEDTEAAEAAEETSPADDEAASSETAAEEKAAAKESADGPSADAEESEATDETDTADEPDEAPDGGPVFEASDRRARITADGRGVHLTLDDQQAEFRWDEIGAVETETSRFGRWYTITVHTPDRRWYPVEIAIPSKARVKEWETRLDEVLDTYFEDSDGSQESGKPVDREKPVDSEESEVGAS